MQTIYLDISNKGVIPCIQAKQSEVGRKFLAIITDNGVPYNIPNNSFLSVWYEGDTDAGNYSSIEDKSAFVVDGNRVIVELVAQMLLKPGSGELCLSVTHGDGGETNTWNIPYCVEYKPGAGSSVPTEYYTALTEAGAVAAQSAAEAKEAAENAKNVLQNNSEVVWENNNADSDFVSSKIILDLSKYKRLEIEDTNGKILNVAAVVGTSSDISSVYISTNPYAEIWSRNVYIANDGISVSDCVMFQYSAWAVQTSNDRLKPHKIYGIIH